MNMKPILGLVLMTVLGFTGFSFGITGEDVLTKVEDTLTAPKDTESKCEMRLANSDGSQVEKRVLKMWAAGKEKRVMKFMEPAGIEGIGLLVEGDNEMYLFLPAMNKVRRIEGGSKNDDFQGTDFSYNELGSYEYKKDYNSEVKSEDATNYNLVLNKKPSSDRKFTKVAMVVNKSNNVPTKIELYEGSALKKVMTISEVKQDGNYIFPVKIRMENVEKKHVTDITLTETKFDQGLADQDIFSKRFLKKKAK